MSGPLTSTAAGRLAWQAGSALAGLVAANALPAMDDDRHPVARFGRAMTRVEEILWRDSRLAGVLYAATGTAIGVTAGAATSTAGAVAVSAAGGQLRREARRVGRLLDRGDLDGARCAVRSLVGRDTSELDTSGVAAAAIESVAENMVDAVFGPAWWAVVAGGPAVGAHRALNTMDAMVGRRDERYERFGWAAARLDDLANLAPARLFAVAVATVAPGRIGPIVDAVRRDAPRHPSPNAGVAEAAMAGALGVELGGPLRYGDRAENRPALGRGPRPTTDDLGAAVRIAERAEGLLLVWLAAIALAGAGVALAPGPVLP